MAFDRRVAIKKIEDRQDTYAEHVMKCVIYGNSTNNLYHWCEEISQSIFDVLSIKLKGGSSISKDIYKDRFFLAYGDTENDFRMDLQDFHKKFVGKYPNFTITNELIQNTYGAFVFISNYCTEKDNKNISKANIHHVLLQYFDF